MAMHGCMHVHFLACVWRPRVPLRALTAAAAGAAPGAAGARLAAVPRRKLAGAMPPGGGARAAALAAPMAAPRGRPVYAPRRKLRRSWAEARCPGEVQRLASPRGGRERALRAEPGVRDKTPTGAHAALANS